jgi:hypothetical protein
VYKGDRGNYSEDGELLPANLYAWSKLGGEAAVRAVPNHLIIRTSFGGDDFAYPAAFTDKMTSKDYVDRIAPQILEAALSPLTGVLNIGGPRRTLFDYAKERNPGISGIELGESAVFSPRDNSLDLSRWQQYQQGESVVRGVNSCRICGSDDLEKYLDLGMMPLANNLAPSAIDAKQMQRFPMQVQFCRECSLSQLTAVVDPREMFSHYTYRSSVSQGYVTHCRAMARSVGASLNLGSTDLVVDIAGNDGTLLLEFRDELGVNVLNVDPAENISAIAEDRGVPTINEFWSLDVAGSIAEIHGKPKLITATNVFAHVDDVREFVGAARECLSDSGALMLASPYGVDFIEHREFDTIYFEHLSYVLVRPIVRLARDIDMEVFDVQKQEIHGGTARVFLGKPGQHTVSQSVQEFLDREAACGFHEFERYAKWRNEIEGLIDQIKSELGALKSEGARIAAFAASAKGNTLLNSCGLNQNTIDYIVDDTPEKTGRFSPGNGIPVVGREVLLENPPDYLVILAWNFAQEIVDNTSEYDGKYIIPIPKFRIV